MSKTFLSPLRARNAFASESTPGGSNEASFELSSTTARIRRCAAVKISGPAPLAAPAVWLWHVATAAAITLLDAESYTQVWAALAGTCSGGILPFATDDTNLPYAVSSAALAAFSASLS
jgi:hypothetical protein